MPNIYEMVVSTCQMNVIPENSRIGALVRKGSSGAGNISFIIHYHDYE